MEKKNHITVSELAVERNRKISEKYVILSENAKAKLKKSS